MKMETTEDLKKQHVSNGRHALREFYAKRGEQKLEIVKLILEARQKRTPEEQLVILNQKLGAGVGAKKERVKLQLAILDRWIKETGENMIAPELREILVQELKIVKMELLAIRCLRRFRLSERSAAEYEEAQ